MSRAILVPVLLIAMTLVGARARAAGAGCSAAGPLSGALPARLLVGINAPSADDTWAAQSGTKWDVQWLYLSGQSGNDWYNGFGYAPADGSWIDDFFTSIDHNGFIPGIHLHNMGFGHDQGDARILQEVQNPTWTALPRWGSLSTET